MRKIMLPLLLLVLSNSLIAQESYEINEYGIYVIDSGAVIKVPITGDYSIFAFWKNYAIFFYWGGLEGIAIFNIENGAIIKLWDESFFGLPRILDDDVYFSILYGNEDNDYIFNFDKISLELIDKIYFDKSSAHERFLPNWETINIEKIGDRTVSYSQDNNFFNVTYGPEVDISDWINYVVYYDRRLNRYAIFVQFWDGK
jgi:hypothetical protein